ncbi:hypothetical protein OG625_36765 [Streptomyces sp. NBC_01351]|uniref:hypothetical protein n=1 Tax=Streptomyces sp. NBC_01351 TaxID=2903833 RepID=UPI002E2FC5FF|nr:hypothetical protein [Streptomyces sp. NBC_01351]
MDRRVWRAAACAVAVLLTGSCGYAAAIHAAEISEGQLVGRWTSPAGTSLTFSKDHTFAGTGFDQVEALAGCGNPGALSTGRWAFYGSADGSSASRPDETVTRGHDLSLTFTDVPNCTVWVYLYGGSEDPAMCPTRDPDAGCPMGGYLKRDGDGAQP